MHAAGAAEGEEGEVARVEAAFDADHAQRPGHLGVGDPDDAPRRLVRVEPEPFPNEAKGLLREPCPVEGHLSAELGAVGQMAEVEVGVGDGRLLTAFVVGGRAGSAPAEWGPTRRAPPWSAQAIEPPPALTVCTSTMGSLMGTPATTVSVVVWPRPDHGRDVGRGTAHVEGEEVVVAGLSPT